MGRRLRPYSGFTLLNLLQRACLLLGETGRARPEVFRMDHSRLLFPGINKNVVTFVYCRMLSKWSLKVGVFGRGWCRILMDETRSDSLNLDMELFSDRTCGLGFCWVEAVIYSGLLATPTFVTCRSRNSASYVGGN